ncbi:phosphatidate cytidylyltransferase [Thioclava dalianensis]|uniref:Phosphatidate cytidylyltransferase n=1 Tax=Thioclava dalianensis TaxID=1185766 RepID=A0A074U5Z0_9RHOB|nr:phosphatidate cytidylyltransferase [Thioclava dalianensis]KEP70067.1 phosphatidate cytidylyltransferase [Thioclava dalianensis]SFN52135.1 phosphatidate cytidylyltransferase [Thioclava dalianensis]
MSTQRLSGKWGDLVPRLSSSLVMILVGVAAIWWGGAIFAALAVLVCGVMVWELIVMLRPERPGKAIGMGLVAAALLTLVFVLHEPMGLVYLLIVPIMTAVIATGRRMVGAGYSLALMLTGYGLVALREGAGVGAITWIVAIVVVSDISGYFIGRLVGGPKFWPRISPKKTWSGTVAGWVGAVLVGLVFVEIGASWQMLWISPLLAFAGQLGDIAESALKRAAGVKDSSTLIPGHGGVLDRFDALTGAVIVLIVLSQFMPLPLSGL